MASLHHKDIEKRKKIQVRYPLHKKLSVKEEKEFNALLAHYRDHTPFIYEGKPHIITTLEPEVADTLLIAHVELVEVFLAIPKIENGSSND